MDIRNPDGTVTCRLMVQGVHGTEGLDRFHGEAA
jgi:hypothetical protein